MFEGKWDFLSDVYFIEIYFGFILKLLMIRKVYFGSLNVFFKNFLFFFYKVFVIVLFFVVFEICVFLMGFIVLLKLVGL